MAKKSQKRAAWLAVFTFVWLLQVSTKTIANTGASETGYSVKAEPGPDFVEAAGQKAAPAAKKSILPYILIGVGAVAVAAVLLLVVFKTNHDVTGTWAGTETTYGGAPSYSHLFIFRGDKKSGTVETVYLSSSAASATAPYTVNGNKVAWSSKNYSYAGAFDSPLTMKGDIIYQDEKIGTFAISKTSSAAVDPVPQGCDIVGSWLFEFINRGSTQRFTIIFTGNKASGEFAATNSDWMAGTYTVVDNKVTLSTKDKPDIGFDGRFTTANMMAGGWVYMSEGWNWTATRVIMPASR